MLCASVSAQPGMSIEADQIDFNASSSSILASGNVSFSWPQAQGQTGRLLIDWPQERFSLQDQFSYRQGENFISGTQMDLAGHAGTGDIGNFYGRINKAFIRSKRVEIQDNSLHIKDASFTTCDLPSPHYQLSASDITVYPVLGMIVIQNAVFWIQDWPVFYLPTYIYGGPALLASSQFIPDFLDDPVQGFTVRQRFGYFISPRNAGHVELSWTTRLGYGYGLTHGFRWRNLTDVEFEYKSFTVSGVQGHLDIRGKWLPRELAPTENFPAPVLGNLLTAFSESQKGYHLQWQALWRSREIVNNQRISVWPEIRLSSSSLLEGLSWLLAAGNFSEEGTLATERYRVEAETTPQWPLTDTLTLQANLSAHSSYYGSGAQWQRVFAGSDLIQGMGFLRLSLGYAWPLLLQGGSPFLFDNYQVQTSPEYRFSIKHVRGYYALWGAYETNFQRFRELYLQLEQPLHEWRLSLNYDLVGKTLNLGFRLADL